MATKAKKSLAKPKEAKKKVSKSWLAFQKNIGTGKIMDMKAVLK